MLVKFIFILKISISEDVKKLFSVMVKYSSQSFTTEHSTAEKKITSPIIEKKDLIRAR